MKKPYLHGQRNERNFLVCTVDGKYIRDRVDIEFTNFGQHYRFPFIPKRELWLDRECVRGEAKYFIPRLMSEYELMNSGVSYARAVQRAGKLEAALRARDSRRRFGFAKPRTKIQKEKVLRLAHKKLLAQKDGGQKIWIVRGELVRKFYYLDFTQGGHEFVYPFVPRGEIWLDDDLFPNERKLVLLHELHERYLMGKKKFSYLRAHRSASTLELRARRNSRILAKNLRLELNRNRDI